MIDCISLKHTLWSGRTSLERALIIASLFMFVLSLCLIISVAVLNKKLSDAETSPTEPLTSTILNDISTSTINPDRDNSTTENVTSEGSSTTENVTSEGSSTTENLALEGSSTTENLALEGSSTTENGASEGSKN